MPASRSGYQSRTSAPSPEKPNPRPVTWATVQMAMPIRYAIATACDRSTHASGTLTTHHQKTRSVHFPGRL